MKPLFVILITFFALTQIAFAQSTPDEIKQERVEMLNKLFSILEQNIANKSWLEEESFNDFREMIYTDSILTLSESDFHQTFRQASRVLPFTHFRITRTKKNSTPAKKKSTKSESAVSWNAIDDKTAYLRIRTFSTKAQPFIKAVNEIGVDKYENLIIDLRNNGGGSIAGPVVLGEFLTQQPIDAGYYLTKKWFENHDNLPTPEDVNQMPFLEEFTFGAIMKMFADEEAFRTVIPGHKRPVFKGKVYVLINKGTASACEPFIDLLKKKGIATLVGQTSSGSMLSGKYFEINEKYKAFIPIADYYCADGSKIDKIGVAPDIEVESSDSKEYVLNIINEME